MRYAKLTILLAALLIGACGNAQQAAGPASSAQPAAAANAPQPAATDAALLEEGRATEPSPTALAAPATSAPATSASPPAAETAQMILPPATEDPTSAPVDPTSAPAPTSAPMDATSAPAAPQSAPAAQSKASPPVRLVIKDIGINRPLVSVGLDKARMPIVPRHDVGWYNLSAEPGQGENIVLWGHVLPFKSEPNIAPPFGRLKELQIGAVVVLYDRAGTEHRYVVKRQVLVTPDQVEYILPVGRERVTLVSCIGDKVISNGSVVDMTHRLITIAEPEA